MKNLTRLSAIAFAVGACLCIVGFAAGGRLYSNYSGGRLHPWGWGGVQGVTFSPRKDVDNGESAASSPSRQGIGRSSGSVWPDEPLNGIEDIDGSEMQAKDDELRGQLNTMQFDELDFELGAGNYTIVTGEGFGIVEGGGEWLDSWAENGEWHIRTDDKWFNLGRGAVRSCVIAIPEDCRLEKLKIAAGAANVEFLAPVTAEKVEFEIGAGNLEIDALRVTKKAGLEVGMGNLTLGLAGSADDFQIVAEAAMGTVSIDGRDLISGLAGTARQGNGGYKIDAEVGMGNIEIYTGQ